MSVHFFRGCDLDGQPVEFNRQHEREGFIRIAQHLWEKLESDPKLYYIVANLRCTMSGRFVTPDVIILSEMGLGVMELKHSFGVIDCGNPKGTWRAGPIQIKPYRGAQDEKDIDTRHANPHEQVQDYAEQIRRDLIQFKFKDYFIQQIQEEDEYPKIGTAICFTHPEAVLAGCKAAARIHYHPPGKASKGRSPLAAWESFRVLSPAEVPEWAFSLGFGMDTGFAGGLHNLSFDETELEWLAREFFKGQPWPEIDAQLKTRPQPYGYLALMDQGEAVQYYPLVYEEEIVGRGDEACSLLLSGRYTLTSRKHLHIYKTEQGLFLEDEASANGTYINGSRITERVLLPGGTQLPGGKQRVTLGGPAPGAGVPELRFVNQAPPAKKTRRDG